MTPRFQHNLVTASAEYRKGMLSDRVMLSTLTPLFTVGSYNVFHTNSGDDVVIFANQPALLEMVNAAPNALYFVRLLKKDARYYKYTVQHDGVDFEVLTVGELSIILNPTDDQPVEVQVTTDGNVYVS